MAWPPHVARTADALFPVRYGCREPCGESYAVVSLVFVIGTLNLVLGFALAVALERRVVVYLPTWGGREFSRAGSARDTSRISHAVQTLAGEPEPSAVSGARAAELSAGQDDTDGPLAEVSLRTLQWETTAFLDALLGIEEHVRHAVPGSDTASLRAAGAELIALAERWVTRQCEMVRKMAESREQWGTYTDLERRLEDLLLDQSPTMETSCRTIQQFDPTDTAELGTGLLREITQFTRGAHELRDCVIAARATVAVGENVGEAAASQDHRDPLTGLSDRIGLALLCDAWSREEDRHQRPIQVALLDLDGFGRINAAVGTRTGDHLLQAVGELLRQELDADHAQVGRFNGQQFLLVLQHCEVDSAVEKLERIGRRIARSPFQLAGQQYALTVRSGLTSLGSGVGLVTVFERLQVLTETARRAGSRVVCSEGEHVGDLVATGYER